MAELKVRFLGYKSHYRPQARRVEEVVEQTWTETAKNLRRQEEMIIAVRFTKDVIKETGVSGACYYPDFIQLELDADHSTGFDNVLIELGRTIFHESCHATRWASAGYSKDLLDAAISEGLATTYERDFAGSKPLWGDYSDIDPKEWLPVIKKASWDDYRNLFFNHESGKKWIGYKTGTWIIDQAIELNPNETAATLAVRSTAEILQVANV